MNDMNYKYRIVDGDQTAKLSQSRILSQGGLAILAQANQRPEMALALLR